MSNKQIKPEDIYERKDYINIRPKLRKEIVDRNINDLYVGNISLSMAQQNHNDLYTKLFRN